MVFNLTTGKETEIVNCVIEAKSLSSDRVQQTRGDRLEEYRVGLSLSLPSELALRSLLPQNNERRFRLVEL